MKKLFAILMIAGVFGFASCGGAEKAADEAAATADTAAPLQQDEPVPQPVRMLGPAPPGQSHSTAPHSDRRTFGERAPAPQSRKASGDHPKQIHKDE